MIKSLHMTGILSFRDTTIELRPLNVLIGPNASGKSNLIEVVGLLQALPTDLPAAIRQGGGIGEWLWKGDKKQSNKAVISASFDNLFAVSQLRYTITLGSEEQKTAVLSESLDSEVTAEDQDELKHYVFVEDGVGKILGSEPATEILDMEMPDELPVKAQPGQSILRERYATQRFPEISFLRNEFEGINIYRDWTFNHNTSPRRPQPADLPNDFLDENCRNLALMLSRLDRSGMISEIEDELRRFYPSFRRISIHTATNTATIFMHENGMRTPIPATRLSNGTLRYLCLLSILCHLKPPGLICIEEPELGLHPDMLVRVAELLQEASTRGQIIVTTHSPELIDALSDQPEAVVVCERSPEDGQTEFRRLSEEKLAIWLDEYRLGQLWRKGEIGGNRW